MKQIWFKRKYLEPIKRNEKTQTLRVWKKQRVSEHDNVELFFGFKQPRLLATVTRVRILKYHQLSDIDIKLDGFKDRCELLKALQECYHDFDVNQTDMYLVGFKICDR